MSNVKKMNRIVELKAKVCALAMEAQIIRREEARVKARARHPRTSAPEAAELRRLLFSMSDHRRGTLRREARSGQLAYAFLRGRRYRDAEPTTRPHNGPNWDRVAQLAMYFGPLRRSLLFGRGRSGMVAELREQLLQWVGAGPPVLVVPGADWTPLTCCSMPRCPDSSSRPPS